MFNKKAIKMKNYFIFCFIWNHFSSDSNISV